MINHENDIALTYIDRDWPRIEEEIVKNVTDWSICIQAGGHFGLYPKRLSTMFDKVYTFEADEGNYKKLVKNCNEPNIISFNLALSAYTRTMDVIHLQGGNSGQNIVVSGTQTSAITIDSLNLPSCGLIQLDIERHELFALIGAIETIEKYKPIIMLEGPETTNDACNIILEQLGYDFVGRAGVDSVFKYTNKLTPTKEYSEPMTNKKILIAIPTARYIEADTFKSIYDLEIPEGYEVTFQHFYGYRVDQVRNLIADWVVRGFDYLFSVDHDITFPSDTLKKLLSHDKDLVSGVYRQRLEPQLLEIYEPFGTRMSTEDLYAKNWNLVGIGGCGFGCVLVKKEVFVDVGYPQFEYHHALNHNNTISEDTDFCKKAINKGFKLWCDPSIRCGHIGSTTMHVELPQVDPVIKRLRELHDQPLLPKNHVDYLWGMRRKNISPKVIYDIGACVLHWTNPAKEVWPDAKIIPIEAMQEVGPLYTEKGFDQWVGGCLLSDCEEDVEFYENLEHPGGNSLYKENNELSPMADQLFPEENKVKRRTATLDNIVKMFNLPSPDMIKMDIQGAELKALKGATETLKTVEHLILELQHKDYNFGAPKSQEVIDYLKEIGFKMVGDKMFCGTEVDGDYHFTRTRPHQ